MFQGQGYRLLDLERFSIALSEAHVCEKDVKFSDVNFSCASELSCKLISYLKVFTLSTGNLLCLR